METIINKDCIDGMKELQEYSIDFVLTDPPFNVGIDYDGIDDSLNDEKYSDWCFQWVSELYRVLKEGKYAIIFTGDKKCYYLFKAIMKSNFLFHHFMKWHKPSGQRALSGTVFFNRTELAFLLSKNKPDLSNINRKKVYADTLICENTSPNDKYNAVEHNCRRPVQLYRQIIQGFTKERDVVLDCFMGSGTTALACKQTNRDCIGYEINPNYIELINKRLTQTTLRGLETELPLPSANEQG